MANEFRDVLRKKTGRQDAAFQVSDIKFKKNNNYSPFVQFII
jgi:hypothetical protein